MPKKTKSKAKAKPKSKPKQQPKTPPDQDVDLATWAAAAREWSSAAATTQAEIRQHNLVIKCTEMLAREIRAMARSIQGVSGA